MRTVLTAAAVAVGLAGCGDDLEAFRDDLRPLEARAEEQRGVIAAELQTLDLGSELDARSLRVHTTALAETYDEIAALEPPDEYAEPFAAHVRANDSTIRGLRLFAAELQQGDARGLRRAGRLVADDLGESQSARLRWLE